MIIAIISDIHGNYEAFTRVMQDIGSHAVDRIISLGDNIGYGADSERIMNTLAEYNIDSVLGNHELAVTFKPFIKWFNPRAQVAVRYTNSILSEASKQSIGRLKKSFVMEDMRFVHGAPLSSVALYLFQISDERMAKKMASMPETLCFTGHTHDLGLIEYDGTRLVRSPLNKGETRLEAHKKYIINAGSVGQPRDGDSAAKYLLFDTHTRTLELRQLPYDYKTAAAKILQTGMPEDYARKLYPRDER